MENFSNSSTPHSCRTKACIGIIRLTMDMRRVTIYRSRFFGVLSWTQCLLGISMIFLYVILYCQAFFHASDFEGYFSMSNNFGGGILVSGVQILGAGITLLAINDSNYCWLHSAMSLHIVSIVGHFLLSLHMIMVIFPIMNFPVLLPDDNSLTWNAISKSPPEGVIEHPYWKHTLMMIVTVCSLASVCFGSFLGTATGYGIFCETDGSEKRKSSTAFKDKMKEPKQTKLVKFKSFEPTNVAANLGAEQFTSFENYMQAKEDSIIYVNRHALNTSVSDASQIQREK